MKILDFGLAKSVAETAKSSASISPTLSLAMTQAGMILGTAAYMAPEQARGKPVDKRADIWAFGVVLYEMLTGRQLFGGETVADTLASVVKDAPDLKTLPADAPPHIRRLLERCLQKDPSRRLRDIGEARIAIDEAPPAPATVATPLRKGWIPWAVAAIAVALAIAGWRRPTRPAELRPLVRMELDPGSPALGSGSVLALSPDGIRFVIAARDKQGTSRLYSRLLSQGQLTPLPGTENANAPFFSPDGRWMGFAAGGKLKKISVDGGPAIPLCDAVNLRGASWGDDDSIVFSVINTGLQRISAAGGTQKPITTLSANERTHRWPQVLPGSKAVLFTSHTTTINYDDATVEVLSLASGQRKVLRRGAYMGQYVSLPDGSGRLLYVHGGTLYAARFDPASLEMHGDGVPVLQDIHAGPISGASLAVAQGGTLAHLMGPANGGTLKILWIDPAGKKEPILPAPSLYIMPRISPDGRRMAYGAAAGADWAIWVKDLDRDVSSRLTFLSGSSRQPVWTPDGKFIVFMQIGPAPGVYAVRADGGGQALRLSEKTEQYPMSFSPDGKVLAIAQAGAGGAMDVATMRLEGGWEHPRLSAAEPFVATPAVEFQPAFSPDGRWIAYNSNESGQAEVYVRPFPGPGGRWQVSEGGGSLPAWSRNGELFYEGPDNRIYAVGYTVRGDSFAPGKPRRWSEVVIPDVGATSGRWDIAADGKRAVASIGLDEEIANLRLVFLLHFTDELQRRSSGK